ncbi:neuropeptide CCHamide-2 receptor [Argonauta hians]
MSSVSPLSTSPPPQIVLLGSPFWIFVSRVFPIVFIAIGTIGNLVVMTIFVAKKELRRSPNTTIMFVTSLIDIALLYTSLLWKWFTFLSYPGDAEVSGVFCKLRNWITTSLGLIESWYLLAVTLHRTWLVYRPLSSLGQSNTQRKSIIEVVCLMLIFFLISSHMLYGIEKGNQKNITRVFCFEKNSPYLPFYVTWVKIIPYITFIVPTFLLLILDISLLYRLGFFCCKFSAKYRRSNNNATRNVTLIFAINIVYLVTTTPILFFKILNSESFNWYIVCNLLLYIRNTFGFLTYFTNVPFRRTVLSMYHKRFGGRHTTNRVNSELTVA